MPLDMNSSALNDSAPKPRKTRAKSDRHSNTTSKAEESTSNQVGAIALASKQFQGKITSQLERVANEREAAVEQVSDVLSYLYSPATFQAEVMQRAAEKLGIQQGQSKEDEPVAIDLLADSWGDFSEIEYPSLPGIQSSVLGCLPC